MADVLHQLAASNSEPMKKPSTEAPVLLLTTVDIGGGKSDRIEVRRGEDPADVARAFCDRHGLPHNIIEPLTTHLKENLSKALTRPPVPSSKSPEEAASVPVGPDPPLPTESPRFAETGDGNAAAEPERAVATGEAGGKPQYSFGTGMDEQFQQKLDRKLMDESSAPADRRNNNWINAGEVLNNSGHGRVSGQQSKRSSMTAAPAHAKLPQPASGPGPRDSVHERLYSIAQERSTRLEERRRMAAADSMNQLAASRPNMSWISAEMMRGRGANGQYGNYGEMLYAEGVESLMSRLQKGEVERKARDDRELEGVTWMPAITRKAYELKMRERQSSSGGFGQADASGVTSSLDAAEDPEKWLRLHTNGMRKQTVERMEQLRQAREQAEVAECTFHPRINKKSDAMMAERAETLKVLNITHHEQLFADAIRRNAKMAELQQWYPDGVTFQPQVNKNARAQAYVRQSWEKLSSSAGAGGSTSPSGEGPKLTVVDRLYSQAERKQAKLEAARQMLHGPIDPATNKPLYIPETGRGPRAGGPVSRNKGGKDIGEYLYQRAHDLAAKRAEKEEAERRAAEEVAMRVRTTGTSQRMFTDLKLKRFRQIYEYLSGDRGTGDLDLLALLGRAPSVADPSLPPARAALVDSLDNEVLMDVEAAADVWARANSLMMTDAERAAAEPNGLGTGSPRSLAAAAATGPPPGSALPGPCPPLSLELFISCMEEAIHMRRGPRAYLVPSPSAKQAPAPSFRPAINPRSKALAARVRPDSVSAFEALYGVARRTADKLEALRREKEAAGMEGCTFAPRLNANSRQVEGRALNRAMAASRSMDVRSSGASGFAMAAAGIMAASEAAGAADARTALDQQQRQEQHSRELAALQAELDAATAQAADVQAQLLQSGGVSEDELTSFSLLEKELRDMQALTQVAMDDVKGQVHRQDPGRGQQQQQLYQPLPPPPQQQRRMSSLEGGAPVLPLEALAAAVEAWDHRADPRMTSL